LGAPLGDRKGKIALAAVALPLLLPGCVVPVAISAASAGFDGITYIATGKSPSDHAISKVADQNCSAWRIFAGRAICRDYTPEERRDTQIAQARLERRDPAEGNVREPTYAGLREPPVALAQANGAPAGAGSGGEPDAPVQLAAAQPHRTGLPARDDRDTDMSAPNQATDSGSGRTVEAAPLAPEAMDSTERHGFAAPAASHAPAVPAATESAAREPVVAVVDGGRPAAGPNTAAASLAPAQPREVRVLGPTASKVTPASAGAGDPVYLVLASFASRANAEHALGKYGRAHPEIAAMNVRGATLYRVVTGPFDADELIAARGRMERTYGIASAWRLPTCQREGAGDCVSRAPAVGAVARPVAWPGNGQAPSRSAQ